MNTQAPHWSAILFAPTLPASPASPGARTGDRVYQAMPMDTFRKTAPARVDAAPAAPVMAAEIRQVTVARGDVLALKAQPGDYYWKIARNFAEDEAVGAYVKDLIARNGGSSLIKTGQLLNLPLTSHAGHALELAIAVQKVLQLRGLFGDRLPELDWGSVEVAPGPVDSYWVSFREAGSEKRQRFMVSEDMSGLHPGRYTVMSERESRVYFPN